MKEKKNNKPNKKSKSKIVRAFWFCLGIISFVLGTIGIPLPILPTVPLYLLTSFCFVRSSERFEKWFLNSVFYKKYCENFATNHAMVIYSELILLLSVSGILMCGIWFSNSLAVSIILPIVMACKYFYFIFYVKSISKPEYKIMKQAISKKKEAEKALKLQESSQINDITSNVICDCKENNEVTINKEILDKETK